MNATTSGTRLLALAGLLLALAGCVTNPVTGERELGLVGEESERSIGEENYLPSRQMQGGDYVVDPGVQAYVSEVGQRVAAVSDRPLDYEFSVLNNGVPNAWALPGGKIAINRGLLYELDSEAELAAVLGHEVVHAAARHGAQAMERGLLLQGAILATAIAARNNDYGAYVVGGAQLAAQLVNQKYGRGAELESDRYGMIYMARAGYDPRGAVDLQETFVRLSEGRNPDWLSGLFASHPPSQERLEQNRRTAAELGFDGEVGREDYQRAMARLRETRPAYEAYEEGRKALGEGRPEEAMRKAGEAIEIEPEEGLFHGLRGDVAFAMRQYERAEDHYDAAIARNDRYFKFYLGRGESRRRLGRNAAARADLEASMRLLPTADAATALGQLAEGRNELNAALTLYAAAAQSGTPAGQTATRRLIALDLPNNPGRYVTVQARADRQGRVFLELQNLTSVVLSDLRILFAYRDQQGRVRQESRAYGGRLEPGSAGVILLGADYVPVFNSIQAAVTSARAPD